MGRGSQWADEGQNRKTGSLDLITTDGLSVDVYRRDITTGRPGFTSEAAEVVFLRTVNARLDPAQDKSDDSEAENWIAKTQWVGLTDDIDVLQGDLWEWAALDDRSHYAQVQRILPIEAGSQVWLEEIKR